MAAVVDVSEGTVPFQAPNVAEPCSTWYKIFGKLDQSSSGRPLVCLHGGPGAGHNYLLPLRELTETYGITVVLYDQLGCGNSTHLNDRRLDHAFWTVDLFIAELDSLLQQLNITEYDLLGQSWGGMLGSEFAIRQPKGLNRLIVANSPASMKLWVDACNEWRAQLPREIDDILEKYEKLQDYENQDYKDAVTFFYKRHLCLARGEGGEDYPKDVADTMRLIEENDTVYHTMCGPSEFTVIGNLKSWTVEGRLHKIKAPTLVFNGEYDEARAACVAPFANEIPDAVWKTIAGASHMSHVEKPEEVCSMIAGFLKL